MCVVLRQVHHSAGAWLAHREPESAIPQEPALRRLQVPRGSSASAWTGCIASPCLASPSCVARPVRVRRVRVGPPPTSVEVGFAAPTRRLRVVQRAAHCCARCRSSHSERRTPCCALRLQATEAEGIKKKYASKIPRKGEPARARRAWKAVRTHVRRRAPRARGSEDEASWRHCLTRSGRACAVRQAWRS